VDALVIRVAIQVAIQVVIQASSIDIHNLILPRITPLPMERHNMVIHITTHNAATGDRIIRSQVKPGKRGPQNRFLTAVAKVAA
jgi:hypothetical protein